MRKTHGLRYELKIQSQDSDLWMDSNRSTHNVKGTTEATGPHGMLLYKTQLYKMSAVLPNNLYKGFLGCKHCPF